MLRIILLSLVFAVCSTCLVRPWFWIGVKRKDLLNHGGEKIGFNDCWGQDLAKQIIIFIVIFMFNMFSFTEIGLRQNLFGFLPLIILCVAPQLFWNFQGKLQYIIITSILVISAALWIQDIIVGYDISVPLNKVDSVQITAFDVLNDEEVKLFVSSSEIKSIYKAKSATGPTYNNDKYIYTVIGGDNGDGIVFIDKNSCYRSTFIPCSSDSSVEDIRSKYPTQKLVELYITVSDNYTPYKLFAVADKSWLLGTYNVNGYILLNLMTDECQSYTEETLPDFVTNN